MKKLFLATVLFSGISLMASAQEKKLTATPAQTEDVLVPAGTSMTKGQRNKQKLNATRLTPVNRKRSNEEIVAAKRLQLSKTKSPAPGRKVKSAPVN